MKIKSFSSLLLLSATVVACNSKKVESGTYTDLNTGDSVSVIADPATGYAINSKTNKPVYLYVNNHGDTIFTTGQKVNNMIIPLGNGKYEINTAKVKVDDQNVKVKYADYQAQYDPQPAPVADEDYKKKTQIDGTVKIKDGDYKKKIEKDGDEKIKTEDTKTKIEDGKVETKKRKKLL